MRGDLLAFLLMIGGLGCIVAWAVCQSVVALRSYRLRRETDVIKLHVVKGGELPDGASSSLARDYFQLRWLGILANVLLVSGIIILIFAQFLIT